MILLFKIDFLGTIVHSVSSWKWNVTSASSQFPVNFSKIPFKRARRSRDCSVYRETDRSKSLQSGILRREPGETCRARFGLPSTVGGRYSKSKKFVSEVSEEARMQIRRVFTRELATVNYKTAVPAVSSRLSSQASGITKRAAESMAKPEIYRLLKSTVF